MNGASQSTSAFAANGGHSSSGLANGAGSSNQQPKLPTTPQQQIAMLIGSERDWCSKSEETQVFRKRMRQCRRYNGNEVHFHEQDTLSNHLTEFKAQVFDNEHQVLSQVNRYANQDGIGTVHHTKKLDGTSNPTAVVKFLKILVKINASTTPAPSNGYAHQSSLTMPASQDTLTICKTIAADTSHTLNSIIQRFIEESLNDTYRIQLDRTEFILKYEKAGDDSPQQLLFGEIPLKFFKCIYNEKITELNLIKKFEVLGFSEQDWKIKGISYGFEQYGQMSMNQSLSHDSLAFNSVDWHEMQYISLWDLGTPFRLFIRGVDTIPVTEMFAQYLKESGNVVEDLGLYMCVELLHGAFKLAPKRYTKILPYNNAPRFNEWLEFEDLMICCIPRETKICFTLFCRSYEKDYDATEMNHGLGATSKRDKEKDYPVAMICSNLIDHKNTMRAGLVTARMWPDEAAGATQTCAENLSDDITLPPTVLSFEVPEYALPVMFPSGEPPHRLMADLMQYEKVQTLKFGKLARSEQEREIHRILETDPLYKMKDAEKWHIWMNRDSLKSNPEALCKFLLSVPWDQPYAVHMTHQLLEEWEDLDPISALELLDYNYPDSRVREYALSRLNLLSDEEIAPFLLQLVQTLKCELTHDSALARFLLERGLRSTQLIGHVMYWHLASEMHVPSIRERHGLILEEYLTNCGSHLIELTKQKYVLDDLNRIACRIKDKELKGVDTKIEVAREELSKVCWPSDFVLPLDPKIRVTGVKPEKCKVMSSKKLPLWLVFKNADPEGKDVYVIYKAGDDLRQDLLTLQVLKIMDGIWKRENLDLHIQAYGCVCTGDETGMIEVVLNSDTIANITYAQGGPSAAFSELPLEKWLRKWNTSPEEWDLCVENFMYSSAAYCVATYVLGIGDRHNDNIMLQKNGNLFHIDFGHFLNHRKYLAGFIARETAPFIFTKMYAKVLGKKNSEMFNKFQDFGAKAYNILRKNAAVIMMLFILMLGTGIPELQSTKDIEWLRKCLRLDRSDEEAAQHFKKLVNKALNNTRAQLNDAAHIQIHKE
eukprot:CAMPEP_0117450160 /NCGR_PEP_ID=MMETSP0759-20121206/8321_1 /TAXON_ID=63605 /ORGANISM="Percolomonas cosmopolitus, Strain WS" /LENGTH=1050 /DNA_ID=CAMNT_0005242665 /DNA_START=790 /DNA_END=3942 /DNA_ORIENTATION=-